MEDLSGERVGGLGEAAHGQEQRGERKKDAKSFHGAQVTTLGPAKSAIGCREGVSSNWRSAIWPAEDAGEGAHGGEGGAKFFVAGGDATEGLELGEEIFHAMTFAAEVPDKAPQ